MIDSWRLSKVATSYFFLLVVFRTVFHSTEVTWLPPQEEVQRDGDGLEGAEPSSPSSTSRSPSSTSRSPTSSPPIVKYILSWSKAPYQLLEGTKSFRGAQCPQSNCYFTANRSLLSSVADFDAIMFHQRTWDIKKDAPSVRRRSQRYVYWTIESPVHMDYDLTSLAATRQFYNWSLSYRLDSTFPAPYGRVQQVQSHPSGKELDKLIQDFGKKNKKLAQKDTQQDATSKSPTPALAAWVVSNCNSRSGREDLVEQLQKVLKVDVYGSGKCSRLTCKNDAACMDLLGSTYKFYLSLENSLCEDYVTEKFWKVLNYNVIPVLLNGANMTRQAPQHSYIDVKDFSSVEELGSYLFRVSHDPALYASYFWWRDYYTLTYRAPHSIRRARRTYEACPDHPCVPAPPETYKDAFCSLCQSLHDPGRGEERIADLEAWWARQGSCKPLPTAAKNVNFNKAFWAYRSRDSDV